MDSDDLKEKIKKLMDSGKLETVKLEASSASLSEKFVRPVIEENTLKTFAICTGCKAILSTPNQSSSTLHRHLESDSHRLNMESIEKRQTVIRSFFKSNKASETGAAAAIGSKTSIGIEYTKLCCTDLLPFDHNRRKRISKLLPASIRSWGNKWKNGCIRYFSR